MKRCTLEQFVTAWATWLMDPVNCERDGTATERAMYIIRYDGGMRREDWEQYQIDEHSECPSGLREYVDWPAWVVGPPVNMVHDEGDRLVPAERAEQIRGILLDCFRTAPPWVPGLPVSGEVHIQQTYAK